MTRQESRSLVNFSGLPRWNEVGTRGGMVRAALWLVQVVGVGGTFTKTMLRRDFPDDAQIDRRARDLRDYGWVLHSSGEDGSLRQEEQRLVRIGVPVWDDAARRAASPQKAISSKERAAVLERDEYMCVTCGVSAGDTYFDGGSQVASLGVVRRARGAASGQPLLVTQCKRCSAGEAGADATVDMALRRAHALGAADREALRSWIAADRRAPSPIDSAWSAYRRLPSELRRSFLSQLGD